MSSNLTNYLRVAEWNVRSNIFGREKDVIRIMHDEKISLMFLTETDSEFIIRDNFNIQNYTTFYPKKEEEDEIDNVRIVCLARNDTDVKFKLRPDLMSSQFSSIWVECRTSSSKKYLMGGCYREWTKNGDDSIEGQKARLHILLDQIGEASRECERVLIVGDMNLCSEKWNEKNYRYKSLSDPLLATLDTYGLNIANIGLTYEADHADVNGEYATSAIDHAYFSDACETTSSTLSNSSSDHSPIVIGLNLGRSRPKKYTHVVEKRSFRGFNLNQFRMDLSCYNWEKLLQSDNVDEAAALYDAFIKQCLDKHAPI